MPAEFQKIVDSTIQKFPEAQASNDDILIVINEFENKHSKEVKLESTGKCVLNKPEITKSLP